MGETNRMTDMLPNCLPDDPAGRYVGRIWRPDVAGPSVVTVADGDVFDITSAFPTVRDLCETPDPASAAAGAAGERVGPLDDILANTVAIGRASDRPRLLAPIDLQAVKACGVTFASSLVERVIEEQAGGDPALAERVRAEVHARIGGDIARIRPGSQEAELVKATLSAAGMWSQYLEVGLGPDSEVFTKAQPMSSVGWGEPVGLHPASRWNNPEPEIVLIVDSRGEIRGASLGNDVNLRDIEGRSALLLGKAKDNNASCAIGPFVRLFDATFGLDDVRTATISLRVAGRDGFVLTGESSMRQISRDPLDLVQQTIGPHHQYPDGFALFLGTMFAPTEDRDRPGEGFTHKPGDTVDIATPALGNLHNRVALTSECPPWDFGAGHLMRNLAKRGLLGG
jgi:fumarylacetoacetate (FAA) hydrolase family protein